MPQKKKKPQYPDGDSIRLDPEKRLCEEFDSVSVKKFSAPDWTEMGVRVLDNCAEETRNEKSEGWEATSSVLRCFLIQLYDLELACGEARLRYYHVRYLGDAGVR